jgi:hypothetical protein
LVLAEVVIALPNQQMVDTLEHQEQMAAQHCQEVEPSLLGSMKDSTTSDDQERENEMAVELLHATQTLQVVAMVMVVVGLGTLDV